MHWFAHARGHTWGIARNMPRSAPQGITCPDSLDAPPMGRKAPEWVLNQSRMRLRQTFRPQWEMAIERGERPFGRSALAGQPLAGDATLTTCGGGTSLIQDASKVLGGRSARPLRSTLTESTAVSTPGRFGSRLTSRERAVPDPPLPRRARWDQPTAQSAGGPPVVVQTPPVAIGHCTHTHTHAAHTHTHNRTHARTRRTRTRTRTHAHTRAARRARARAAGKGGAGRRVLRRIRRKPALECGACGACGASEAAGAAAGRVVE